MVRSRSVVVVAEVARSGLSGGGGAAALSEDAMFVLVCVCLFFFFSFLPRSKAADQLVLQAMASPRPLFSGKGSCIRGRGSERERERAGSENKGVMHDQAIKGGEKKKCLKSSIQLDDVVQNHFSAFARARQIASTKAREASVGALSGLSVLLRPAAPTVLRALRPRSRKGRIRGESIGE